MQCQYGFELAVATIGRCLGPELTVLGINPSLQLDSHRQRVLAAGATIGILHPLIPREFVLDKSACQLTVKQGKADGLACLGALRRKVRLKTRAVRSKELSEGSLQIVHRRHLADMRGSLNLLLAVHLITKDKQKSKLLGHVGHGPDL
jgi:hypothetical protein